MASVQNDPFATLQWVAAASFKEMIVNICGPGRLKDRRPPMHDAPDTKEDNLGEQECVVGDTTKLAIDENRATSRYSPA